MSKAKSKAKRSASVPNRVAAVQDRRRSSAAGLHARRAPRSAARRSAIADQSTNPARADRSAGAW